MRRPNTLKSFSATMPGWLEAYAGISPVTVTADTLRSLSLDAPTTTSLWQSLAWMGGVLPLFVPLSVRHYRRIT